MTNQSTIKNDAAGAMRMAKSQKGANNDGATSAEPRVLSKEGDATREKDDHSAPERQTADKKPNAPR